MTGRQDEMMRTAHAVTGGAMLLIAVIFVACLGLYFWSRPRG